MAGKQSRQKQISIEGQKAIEELTKTFSEHCTKNESDNTAINTKLDKNQTDNKDIKDKLDDLMPIVDFIPIIKEIVERENEQKAVSKWMIRIGRLLGFLAAAITAVGIIIGAAAMVIKAIVDIKS